MCKATASANRLLQLAQVQSPHSMRMITEVGRRAMLHNSGVGKAVLSVLDDDRVQRLVAQAGMPPKTANTITTLGKLFTDVEATRERGYAIDEEEQELGVRCIAVPVPGAPTPMAISVSGPVTRVDEAFMAHAVPELQEAARELGAFYDGTMARLLGLVPAVVLGGCVTLGVVAIRRSSQSPSRSWCSTPRPCRCRKYSRSCFPG